MQKKHFILPLITLIICLLGIHYGIDRSESTWLLSTYTIAFVGYVLLITNKNLPIKYIILGALAIRISMFFSLPPLSDDFYRFIWDGRLLTQGLNSFGYTPIDILSLDISIETIDQQLYESLNSKIYSTIYPPISQLIFWFSTKSSENVWQAVTIMRVIIVLFDAGTIFLLLKLLRNHKYKIAIYALNPLVTLELTGNIHFEGVMLFFLILGIYLIKKSYHLGALSISLSVATKLIPLMVLPSLLKLIGIKKAIISYLIIGVTLAVMFYPLLSTVFIDNFGSSLNLFFQKFEFNSGIFFLCRQIGIWIVGYDMVATIGPALSILSSILILYVCFVKCNKSSNPSYWYIVIFFIQLIFSTTVHPWYVIPMLGLSAISGFRFPILWSFLIFFSYLGYNRDSYEQPMFVIYAEYFLVIGYALYEIIKSPKYLIKSTQ